MTYRHQVKVPFGHADIAGIVYTPRFTEYCMDAMEAFLREQIGLDWYAINRQGDYVNPVVKLELTFLNSARISDVIAIDVAVAAVGRSSFTLKVNGLLVDQGAKPCFEAAVVLAIVDVRSQRARPIAEAHRLLLEQYQKFAAGGDNEIEPSQ
jgi:acyl-CoA thioesterase FadM